MSLPIILQTHNEDVLDLESRFQNFQANLINLIYPIGSIYMSVNDVSPQVFLGGSWEQIKDTFLLCSGDNYNAGETGGEAHHTLSVDETPSHTHTRGTMEITGSASICGVVASSGSGAITATGGGDLDDHGEGGGTGGANGEITFTASKSWTGETSSVGANQAHNNMPPYLTVYCWKRIS